MKLKKQFIIFSTMLVAEAAVIMMLVMAVMLRKILKETFDNSNVSYTRNLAQVCQESMANGDDLLVLNYIRKLEKQIYGFKYAVFHDLNGIIIAHTDSAQVGMLQNAFVRLGNTEYREDGRPEARIMEYAVPVTAGGQKVGFARIGFSRKSILEMMNRRFQQVGLTITAGMVVALLLGFLSSLYLYKKLMGPLESINAGIKSIATEGGLKKKVPVQSNNELGELAGAINDMVDKLSELDTMKNDFVSSVTHELRSPLSAIKGYVSFLLTDMVGPINAEQKEYLTIIQNNAGRLANFINNVLDVAKIESAKMELNRETFNLVPVVNDLVKFYYPLVSEKKITLRFDRAEETLELFGDREKLNQVITNLVNNAIKFTPENGTIIISAARQPGAAGEELRVAVKDSGIGMPKKELDKIFNKFYQVKNQKKVKGTGLGLTIVKGFVELHGGRIWAESEENKGAEFIFTVPVKGQTQPLNAEKKEQDTK